jgi:hypothetical protein
MSLRHRVEDANILWENGRLEGAFLNALIAVAATARRECPDPKVKDRECFERFLAKQRTTRLSVEYRGECRPIEEIFYKWLRCELVHEGEIPVDIQFISDGEPGTLSFRAGGAPEYILKISHGWFHELIGYVVRSPANTDHFRQTSRGG